MVLNSVSSTPSYDRVFDEYLIYNYNSYYSHEAIGEAGDIAFETVESGEGYVPQFVVPGLHHSILACVAPVDKGKGDADERT